MQDQVSDNVFGAVVFCEDVYDRFIERVIQRTEAIKLGHPLDPEMMMGAQASNDQYEKNLSYIDIGKRRSIDGW